MRIEKVSQSNTDLARPDVEDSFQKDLKAITDVASTYADSIYAVTVGSETLYRGNFTGAELKEKISTVKGKLPKGIKVGTADSWNKFADGTGDAIIGTADIIMVNAFAFWQGASRDNATVSAAPSPVTKSMHCVVC